MDDERHGVAQSRIIFEKGFDNIYLLSGGSTVFWNEYPHLVEGQNVPKPKKAAWRPKREQKKALSSTCMSLSSARSVASSRGLRI